MALSFAGNGTITGLSVGGLPDGVVDGDTLASGVGGGLLKLKTAIKKDTATSTATSMTAITGLSVDITPSSTSNKILVSWNINLNGNGTGATIAIFRGGSLVSDFAPTSPGSRPQGVGQFYTAEGSDIKSRSGMALDNPASTSSLTYAVYWSTPNGTSYLNQAEVAEDSVWYTRVISSITVMEIASSIL